VSPVFPMNQVSESGRKSDDHTCVWQESLWLFGYLYAGYRLYTFVQMGVHVFTASAAHREFVHISRHGGLQDNGRTNDEEQRLLG